MAKNLDGLGATSKLPRMKEAARSGKLLPVEKLTWPSEHVAAVLARAHESGLISGKGGRIAARVSPELIERAKVRTGLRSNSELVEFALANVAVDDSFVQVFCELKGTVDADLDLGL